MDTSDLGRKDLEEPRRRRHSAAFKATVIAECRHPGVSIASVALRHRLNANLLRRWLVMANERDGVAGTAATSVVASSTKVESEQAGFIAMPMVGAAVDDRSLQLELRRGPLSVRVSWPLSAAAQCGVWLREVLK